MVVREVKMDLGGTDGKGWWNDHSGLMKMVADFLVNMSASADVLAQAKVEVDLSAIPLGKNVSSALPSLPPLPSPPACIFTRSHSVRTRS